MAQTEKTRKIPERRCIGCNGSFPKKELVRIVRSSDGVVSLDFTSKKPGRGAYICRNAECLKKAQKAKRFESNLKCSVPDDVLDALAVELLENGAK